MPVAGGAFKGSLALLFAQKGDFEQAHAALISGEPLIKVYPFEHAKFLCKKSQVYVLENKLDDAELPLNQAQKIIEELKLPSHSQVSVLLSESQAFLKSYR